MKLNSLIEFLPYEYKDQDTYKVNGKGILERYLEIFGDYFQDIITSDASNILDIIDIDNTPGYYLNYLWEFLGELPFANTPTISQEVWENYFSGFKDKATIDQLCNQWLNNRNGILEFNTDTVRKLLKCSIALFKIRGTKEFFEILFRLYGIGITITDPVNDNTDLWIPDSHPIYDVEESVMDKDVIYDNSYKCTQCVPVDISISGHGFTSLNDSFFSFKKSIDALFDRFLPYNVRPNITYQGLTLNSNYQISAVAQNGTVITRGNIEEIYILVTVTGDERYGDLDLRYQVSGDGVHWSSKMYDSPSIYIGKRIGTVYFRSVADPSAIAQVTITEGQYIMAYNIWGVINGSSYNDPVTIPLPTWQENKSTLDLTVNGTLRGNIGNSVINRNDLNIRIVETGEIVQSPANLHLTEAGTYTFQLVDFPTRTWQLTITKEDEFTIIANPNKSTWNETNPPSTVVTATSKYIDPSKLTISLYNGIGSNDQLGVSPVTFTAPRAGTYYFLCDQDPNGKMASWNVTGVGYNFIYPNSVSFLNVLSNNVFDEGVAINIAGRIKMVWSLSNAAYQLKLDDYNLQVKTAVLEVLRNGNVIDTVTLTGTIQDTDTYFTFSEETYNITEVGTYQLKLTLNGSTVYSPTYVVTQNAAQEALALYIVPYDENDDGWVGYDPNQDYTSLPYKFDESHQICRFYLERSDFKSGTATRVDNQVQVHVGDDEGPIEYTKAEVPSGTYQFRLNGVSETIVASLIIQKDPPAYKIQCDPPSAILVAGANSVSTTVKVTMDPVDTSGEFTYNINVPGLDVPVDAKDGYVFTTQATGDFTFTVTDTANTDNPVQCTFKVEAQVSVKPEQLEWDATDTQAQSLTIDLPTVQGWTAEISDTP